MTAYRRGLVCPSDASADARSVSVRLDRHRLDAALDRHTERRQARSQDLLGAPLWEWFTGTRTAATPSNEACSGRRAPARRCARPTTEPRSPETARRSRRGRVSRAFPAGWLSSASRVGTCSRSTMREVTPWRASSAARRARDGGPDDQDSTAIRRGAFFFSLVQFDLDEAVTRERRDGLGVEVAERVRPAVISGARSRGAAGRSLERACLRSGWKRAPREGQRAARGQASQRGTAQEHGRSKIISAAAAPE